MGRIGTGWKMESLTADVVVIGAGLSGLSAAYYIHKTDESLRITVLEAKGRVGGRTYSTKMKAADNKYDLFDLGGEWVGKPQPHLHYLLNQFNLETFNPQYLPDSKKLTTDITFLTKLDLLLFSMKLKWLKNRFEKEEELGSTVDALQSDGMTFEKYMKAHLWTKKTYLLVEPAVRSMFGYSPHEMSLLYFIMYIDAAGGLDTFFQPSKYSGKESRLKGGLLQLSQNLHEVIGKKNVRFNQPVTHIIQLSKEKVVVVTDRRLQVTCNRVILAIPPHLAGAIKFNPELPSTKMTLLRNVPLAFIIKFCFTYEESFWITGKNPTSNYGFQSMIHDPECGPIGVVYEATSAKGSPALIGFVSASRGLVSKETDSEDRRDVLLNLLQIHLGEKVREYIEFQQKDWSQESYNGGCFLKSLVPGSTRFFSQDLREPFDRVHFAGTETATVWCGFMNGAIQSGFRTAIEVLQNLQPSIDARVIEASIMPKEEELPSKPQSTYRSIHWLAALAGIGCLTVIAIAAYRDHATSAHTKLVYISNDY